MDSKQKKMNPLVSIITVNYNNKAVTEALIASIHRTNDYPNIEIIVVDNGSRENPVPQWRDGYTDIQFIRSEQNLGFAGGNNLGIRAAKGDYWFLVNNDTEFTPGLIQTLVNQLEADQSIGICSPKIRYYDQPDTLQYAGFTAMNYRTARNKCVGEFEKDLGQYDGLTGYTAFIHGAAMMVRANAAAKAGLMAENYFLYYEEIDWCEQFRKAGYNIGLNMQALIYHKESMSVGKNSALKVFFMNRNRLLFIRKNTPMSNYLLFFVFFLLVVTPRNMLQYIKEGNPRYCLVLLRAIWWNCVHSVHSTQLGYRL